MADATGEGTPTDHRPHLSTSWSSAPAARACARARLRAAGLKTACITKVFPTRSHTVAAQGGISAALGNMGEDDWRWHMYDTVKGSDWLGDQDAIEYLVRNAPAAVYELEHWGVPFSRTDEGKIYQRAFGGMTRNYGKAPIQRTCAAADRTGHAMLHTMYGQALAKKTEFFIEYFALDLIMDDGRLPRRTAWKLDDGDAAPLPRPAGDPGDRRLRPGLLLLHPRPHLHGRRRRHGAARRPAAAGHGVRAVPPHRHLRRRLPDHRRRARRGRLPDQLRGRAVHGALCALREGPRPARHGLPRHDHRDPRGPRRRARRTTSTCTSTTWTRKVLHERLPGISEMRQASSPASTSPRSRSRCCRPCTTTWAASPTNFHGEVVTRRTAIPTHVVPGLMAVGEAACVSVHGANRLGSNSLIDLVVFGRAAGLRCAEVVKPGEKHADLPKDSADKALARLDRFRNAAGGTPTAQLRDRNAARDAEQLRGVPHRRGAGGGQAPDRRGAGAARPTSASPTARWSGTPT